MKHRHLKYEVISLISFHSIEKVKTELLSDCDTKQWKHLAKAPETVFFITLVFIACECVPHYSVLWESPLDVMPTIPALKRLMQEDSE